MKSIISVAMSSVLLLSSAQAVAQSKLADIQQRWAEVNYTLQDDAQSKGFQS